MTAERARGRVAIGVAIACFATFVQMAAPSIYWLDSSEFAAAAFELGVAHPPGHPLAVLVGKLFALLPFGSVAFRVGLASAACAAWAAAMTVLVGAEAAERVGAALGRRDRFAEAVLGGAAGLGYGLCHAATLQAIRPEVYALNAALLLTATWALLRFDALASGALDPLGAPASPLVAAARDAPAPREPMLEGAAASSAGEQPDASPRRFLYLAALAIGLALANHHFVAGLFTLGAIVFLLGRGLLARGRSGVSVSARGAFSRTIGLTMFAGSLGLSLYAYLPLRALRHPVIDWGAPSTVARFVWMVSARAFQKSLGHANPSGAESPSGLIDVMVAIAIELWLLAPLALLGAYVMLRLARSRATGVLLIAASSMVALAPSLVGFDAANPDAYGYLEPAVALLAALAVAAPAALVALLARAADRSSRFARAPRALARAGCAALAIAAALFQARQLPALSLSRFADTDRFAGALLDEAGPRAVVATSYFQTVFALWYLRGVEGRRPDLDVFHRHFLAYPGYRDELLHRTTALAPLLGARDLDLDGVRASAQTRDVLVEYDLDLAPALALDLLPGTLLDRIRGATVEAADRERQEAIAGRGSDALTAILDAREPQTRRFLLWHDVLATDRACRLGLRASAAASIARARALLHGATDPDLEALARRCGF